MPVIVRALLLLACAGTSLAQYRGGSIHWEPVAGTQKVKFTLRTAWERSAGVFTKIINGVPQPAAGTGMYQPVKGDRVKVLGPETPKFIVSNGLFREYLELTVTFNTEQVPKGDPVGRNLPHASPHWSYEATNWFEGITEWEVELPDPHKTYVAEFQGCCRVRQMAILQSDGCIETRYGRGILQNCETPYFLRSTVNLNFVPPPISFIPSMVPYSFETEDSTLAEPLELPILDYRTTSKGMVKIPPNDLLWPQKIADDEKQAGGILYEPAPIVVQTPDSLLSAQSPTTASSSTGSSRRSSSSISSRHLLADDEDAHAVDLETLPMFPKPPTNKVGVVEDHYKVHATAAVTGISVRMLDLEPAHHLTLHSDLSCNGNHLRVPPGSDICDHSFVTMHDCNKGMEKLYMNRTLEKCFEDSSIRVKGQVHSITVPAGMAVDMTDKCETSDPYAFDAASLLGHCDNSLGAGPMCCNVTSNETLTFRASVPSTATKCVEQADTTCDVLKGKYIHEALRVEYSGVTVEGLVKTHLKLEPDAELSDGNFPVTLLMGTPSSGLTMVEFVLKKVSGWRFRVLDPNIKMPHDPSEPPATQMPHIVDIPTNFPYTFGWEFDGKLNTDGNVYLQTLDEDGYFYNHGPQVVNMARDQRDQSTEADDVAANGYFSWTPCLADAGLYYYCSTAVSIPLQDDSGATYQWAKMKCLLLRVVEDLPPKVSFYYKDAPFDDKGTYQLMMGQHLEAVVNASDNFQDTIDFLGVSKVSINTGDELRARVTYIYENVDRAYTDVAVAKMPRLVEPALPSFLNLFVGGPRNATIALHRKHQMDKVISFTPTRMHSGLELEVCFIAVDTRGSCRKIGDWTERCIKISVDRCRYSMQAGQDLTHVAGLFQLNWLQLFALNPTYTTPESAVTLHDTVIRIGHLYTVRKGETVYDLIRRFGSSKKDTMFVNVDLSRQTEESWASHLAVDKQLCLVPDSCGSHV